MSSSLTTPTAVASAPLRVPATSSTSSMKTRTWSSRVISSKRRFSPLARPYSAARRAGKSSRKGHPRRPAIACANVLLPVPGGPNSITARGSSTPCWAASSGWASGRTRRRSMSRFSCCMPATFCHSPPGGSSAPSEESVPADCGVTGPRFSKKTSPGRASNSQLRRAVAPVSPSGRAACTARTPSAKSRCSRAVIRSLPSPRCRQPGARQMRRIHARSPSTRLTAAPIRTSSAVATTAGWRAWRAVTVSASGKSGDSSVVPLSASTRTTASRSSGE